MFRYTHLLVSLLALGLPAAGGQAAPAPDVELKASHATLVRDGRSAPLSPAKDRFGPGVDGVDLAGAREVKAELRFACEGVPAGRYHLGVLAMAGPWGGYLGFAEYLPSQVHLYLNDTRVFFTSHTEPAIPERAGDQGLYQAELRCDRPVTIRPGDVLRVVYLPEGGQLTVGALRLYRRPPPGGIVRLNPPDWGKPQSYWLVARWEEPQSGSATERCRLLNPGVRPRTLHLQVNSRDYFQRPLLSRRETLTLAPGQEIVRAYPRPAGRAWARLSVTATSPGAYPPMRLVRFYREGRPRGPRPEACLNGEWEMCLAPGVEPGPAPPAGAQWQKITVPSLQPIGKAHCAWYRKVFAPPAHVRGERVFLRCGLVLSEAWFVLNGQPVGHERHGSQPFEVDVTAAFRPGQRNELLVGVRDWLAYSPRNRERVLRGEAPIFKDNMVDVAGYPGAASLGIGGSVWLEARPAVSVDDLFVVTSVRNKRLSLRYRLANRGATRQTVALQPRVLDAGRVAKTLPARQVTVPAGGFATMSFSVPWTDARLWWPEGPHLYVLQTDLKPAIGAPDRHLQRFGFRELWIDGISFRLNGKRTKIRSAWAGGAHGAMAADPYWQPGKRLEAIWAWQMRSLREGEVQLSRCHNLAGVKEACDIADETGLMVKIEDADVAQVSFTFDQRYWNAALRHELHVVDIYKNHPSVVMWSAGNENMWGWIYQGEAAKVLGNRWQVKIVRAMRRFDLMRRPIEWEADGDLMGAWEHHALHYPFELSSHPDLPNAAWWGPLDGKTVVPYSMGPITLGQKPLTVGEAFWPATLSHPFGQTILLGDEAYLGGQAWARGWMESSRFLTDGFRDAEFALVDTYTPLWTVRPQTLVLKQETRSFVGGRRIRREVNVHNDVLRPAALTLHWQLQGIPGGAQGTMPLKLGPAELRRLVIDIPLPAVKQMTKATLRLELWEGSRRVHTETRAWAIHPPIAIRVPRALGLAVFDPAGATAAMLRRLKVPFTPVRDLGGADLAGASAVLLGREALRQAPSGPWREALGAFVRGGGKAALLEQSESPDFLPVPLTQVAKRRTTMAFVRAADHPVLAGLTDADLRWWADDHYVSAGNYRKPVRGNSLPLVDVGTMDGIVETPLLEEYEGKGSYILCQMLLTAKAPVAPPAARMLQNLLDYLASPRAYRTPGATALLTRPDSLLRKALDDSRLVYEDVLGRPEALTAARFAAAVVDMSELDAATSDALRAFARAGGHVLLHRATPEQQALVEGLLGVRLGFFPMARQPNDITYHAFRRGNSGLLAGISNHELFWPSNRLLPELRHEGGWWSAYECPPQEWIADSFCVPADEADERVVRLTRPGALLQVPMGAGYFLLSQLRLDDPRPELEATVGRLRSLLLTNLGCTLRGEGGAALARRQRLAQYEYAPVDLSPYANRGLRDDKAAGIVGWTNQGENDMRSLPTGRQVFAGVPFHIATPRAAVVLHSVMANNTDLPKEVKGIRIGRRADALFFLHTIAWGAEKPFRYRVNYEDGTSIEIPIVNGQHVLDWWSDPTRYAEAMAGHGMFVAWQGDNPMHKGVLLPGYEWANPHPQKPIRDLDFLTVPESGYSPVPVLVGLTVAVSRPAEGVVVDIIGTEGVKVRLGTQVQDVYYIGVSGIAKEHRYHTKAVAAHRALVVGQKVTLQRDVVTRDADGRELAYVYLGTDVWNVNNLVNAKLIGDGLGKLGNFAGNDRQRMYLENLGFIAQQRKAGLWAEAR